MMVVPKCPETGRERSERARRRMHERATARWYAGRRAYGTRWTGQHPLPELVNEMADATNYLLLLMGEDRTVPADLMRALESLSLTFELRLMDLEDTGRDLTHWELPPAVLARLTSKRPAPAGATPTAPSTSSAPCTPPSSSGDNSAKSRTK